MRFLIVIAFVACTTVNSENLRLAATSKNCIVKLLQDRFVADCKNMAMDEIPRDLDTTTAILDMTNNTVTKLLKDSFTRLHNLQYIYLKDNQMNEIHADAFAHLDKLEMLDLSRNNLVIVPREIFSLPQLRVLLISDNFFASFDFTKISRPIKAPLESLDVANCSLTAIPNLGTLPQLTFLNISYNKLLHVEPHSFAPYCQLSKIDLTDTIENKCLWCQIERFLLLKRGVTFSGQLCNFKSGQSCNFYTMTKAPTKPVTCDSSESSNSSEKSTSSWITRVAIVSSLFIVLICAALLYHYTVKKLVVSKQLINTEDADQILHSRLTDEEVL